MYSATSPCLSFTDSSMDSTVYHGERQWLTAQWTVQWALYFQHHGQRQPLWTAQRRVGTTDSTRHWRSAPGLTQWSYGTTGSARAWTSAPPTALHTLAAPVKLELALSAGSEALEASVHSPQLTLPQILNLKPVPTPCCGPSGTNNHE